MTKLDVTVFDVPVFDVNSSFQLKLNQQFILRLNCNFFQIFASCLGIEQVLEEVDPAVGRQQQRARRLHLSSSGQRRTGQLLQVVVVVADANCC